MNLYSDVTGSKIAQIIKSKYTNFRQVLYKGYKQEDYYFEALSFDGNEDYIKVHPDGKVFFQSKGKWKIVEGFVIKVD